MAETLHHPKLNPEEKRLIVAHFILTMVAKTYCCEYIAECLALLVPALDPEALAYRNLEPEKEE